MKNNYWFSKVSFPVNVSLRLDDDVPIFETGLELGASLVGLT